MCVLVCVFVFGMVVCRFVVVVVVVVVSVVVKRWNGSLTKCLQEEILIR